MTPDEPTGGNDRMTRVRMPADLHAALEAIGARDDRTVSWVIRAACASYVEADVEQQRRDRRNAGRRARRAGVDA